MEVFRYWIGASPEAPREQEKDLATLHAAFRTLDSEADVEEYGMLGSMILLKVETPVQVALDFAIPGTVVAFEHRRYEPTITIES